jgi:hypothetical protein
MKALYLFTYFKLVYGGAYSWKSLYDSNYVAAGP